MGKITEKLRKLGLKINGTTPTGETISETIDAIADDYEGGSGATYTAGNGIAITEENVINADVKVIETSNITGLTTEQCESLNVGDIVVKLTSNQKHTYTVSYKEAGVSMCLTYVDASVSETVSYDYTDGNWVYNSTDVTQLGGGSGGNIYKYDVIYNDSNHTNVNNVTILSSTDYDLGEEDFVASDEPDISQAQMKILFDFTDVIINKLFDTLDTSTYRDNTHSIGDDLHGYIITNSSTSQNVVFVEISYDETTDTYSFNTTSSQIIGSVSIFKTKL